MTDEQLWKVVRSLIRMNAQTMIELDAVRNVLLLLDPTRVALAITPAREQAQTAWKGFLERIDRTAPDSLEDMLRKFEGPPQ